MKKQKQCPECRSYNLTGRNNTIGGLVLCGFLGLPFLGIGVLFWLLAVIYLIANKPFLKCKDCGYKWVEK